MTTSISVYEAKTHLSRLLRRVSEGEEIVISRGSVPVAVLVPYGVKRGKRRPGSARGRVTAGENFDAPLPADVLDSFER